MTSVFQLAALLTLAASPPLIEARFVQVAPLVRELPVLARSSGQTRAVVLIHGLYLNPLKKDGATRAVLRDWQKPGSQLTQQLAMESDVFAFAYSQTSSADDIVATPQLAEGIDQLRRLGYHEIVLIGYSAGGVIAREFVEDHPRCGVTKVIQVCAPNTGSGWAALPPARGPQADFLSSLTRGARRRTLRVRGDRVIPPHVQFACVVGVGAFKGDMLVSLNSQWSEDLQRQGIPAFPLSVTHWHAMRGKKGAELLVSLIRSPLPRWDSQQVARARKDLWKGTRVTIVNP